MGTQEKTDWRLIGEEVGSCMCDWGCPCQFDAVPTHGRCEGIGGWQIREGYFGATRLDGVRFALLYWWPGPIYEGNGWQQVIIDEQATPEQRAALTELTSGRHGGGYFEVFASTCTTRPAPMFAPITFQSDREQRQAHLHIAGLAEVQVEPIKTRVTGEQHRARIVLPGGFEFEEAEMGNAVSLRAQVGPPLTYDHENTYAQLNAIDWSGS